MSLIITNLIYSLIFCLLTAKEFITEKYDHDIDQFMYFGSRLLHGELIWTKEFDDKSPVLQYIYSLAAAFKNTSVFVFITLIISIIAALLGYFMLKNILQNSRLELNKKTEDKILYFGTILYLTLLVSIYGSFHHINAISSSLCLISIALTYFNKEKKSKVLLNLAAIASALSISIRPYYLLNILVLPVWISLRGCKSKTTKKAKNIINGIYINAKSQLVWIAIIIGYIILLNVFPYLFSGNLTDFISGIKLNSIDYVNHNIFERQYINIGRNPILYPIILSMIMLPFIRIIFGKINYKLYKSKKESIVNISKLDIDIIFFGLISPILLELTFYRKHFFGHYFTLFSPYIFICIVILIAILARLDKIINNFRIVKITLRTLASTLLVICLITNQSITNTVKDFTNKNTSYKTYQLKLIREFISKETTNIRDFSFLAPESNYLHWQLDESRHGFPQKSVFRNIANGKMDNLIEKYKNLDYKFLLPTKDQLCEVLNNNAPKYIITEKNDYSFNCLKNSSSSYKLVSRNKKLEKNNIFIFKRVNY